MLKKIKSLQQNQGFIKYFKNISWLFLERVFRMIVGLFVGVWVARYLGPEQFGIFSYAQSFVGLFVVISSLGLNDIVVRELLKDKFKKDELLGTVFFMRLLGAFIVLIILALAINFTSGDSYTNTLIFIIASSTIFQSFNVIDFYFQSKVLSKYVVYSNLIALLISSIIKITLILNEASLIYFAMVVVFESFVLACGYIYFYLKNNQSIRDWRFIKSVAKNLLKDSYPLILSGLVISIYMKMDQIMIFEMLGSGAVGQYSAALRLSEVWYFIPMIIASSLFPAILNAKKISEKLYYERIQKLYDLLVWIAVFISVMMSLSSNLVVELLYGKEYSETGSVLIIYIWASVFVFLGVASSKWFLSENLQKYSFYRTLCGAIINLILNYILIPIYSIYGAAVATLISQIFASYLFNAFNKKLRYTFLLQTNALFLPLRVLGVKFG